MGIFFFLKYGVFEKEFSLGIFLYLLVELFESLGRLRRGLEGKRGLRECYVFSRN